MRLSAAAAFLLLTATVLGGCLEEDEGPVADSVPFPLQTYRFAWEGADVAVDGTTHGWLLSVHNPSNGTYETTILPFGLEEALLGPVRATDSLGAGGGRVTWLPARVEGGASVPAPSLTLGPGEGGVFLVQVEAYSQADPGRVGVRFLVTDDNDPLRAVDSRTVAWNVTSAAMATGVAPGDHVRTVTVGVWANGTSFYTNSADLLADAAFPAGFDHNESASDPLPVYVYDQSRDEQPEGSKDRCWFTTIAGYNALLRSQSEGSTGVRFLPPESAYTLPGNEDHPLYGDPLVFLNTVVAHEGPTGLEDEAPDPTGDCFQDRIDEVLQTLPPVPPAVPWLTP